MDDQEALEIWNEICSSISGNHIPNENVYEEKVISTLKILGWKEHRGEIKRKPKIQIGRSERTEPDIVLYDNQNNCLAIIEVKCPTENLKNSNHIQQLTSYMGVLRCKFGILFGNQAHIYYEGNLIQSVEPLLIDKFEFINDNKHGIDFVKLLSKNLFIDGWYMHYVENRKSVIDREKNVEKLSQQLVSEQTKQKIITFLISEFKDFGEEIASKIIHSMQIDLALPEQKIASRIPAPNHTVERMICNRLNTNILSVQDEEYTLSQLAQGIDLTNADPVYFKVNNLKYQVKNWTELDTTFVRWLIENSYLANNKLPIRSASGKYKAFINRSPNHLKDGYDGLWKKVSDHFFVDTKYNAQGHVRNYQCTLEQLNISDMVITIAIRKRQ